MADEKKTLAEILEEEEQDELRWDYRLMTKREKRRFLQKKRIIQDNYSANVDRLSNKVTFSWPNAIAAANGNCPSQFEEMIPRKKTT